jgi:hypothetical protein
MRRREKGGVGREWHPCAKRGGFLAFLANRTIIYWAFAFSKTMFRSKAA